MFYETFRSFFRNNLKFSVIFYFGTFFYDWKWQYDQIDLSFFAHFKKFRSVTEKSSQKTGWNTVKGNVFDFSNNSISSALHGCCSICSNCLILHPIKSMFFNEMIQFVEDGLSSWANPTLRQHNSPVFFVSWLANLQHKINWTFSEVSVVSSS